MTLKRLRIELRIELKESACPYPWFMLYRAPKTGSKLASVLFKKTITKRDARIILGDY
ncbi:MAG: hypothetical protein AOA66_1673 [Candidatus Bathyarchaeota archaeon BA2]|nr:MAG: hypothetical protein AOA66_1673 [Candidatus Bathyarchaeota archaeon BA2]